MVAGLTTAYLPKTTALAVIEASVAALFAAQIISVDRRIGLGSKFTTLEQALANDELFDHVSKAVAAFEEVSRLQREHPQYRDVLANHLHQLYRESEQQFDLIGDGVIVIRDPAEEIPFAYECLHLIAAEMLAISYGEREFWNLPEGDEYLRQQKKVIDDGGKRIQRIFLLKTDELTEQKEAITKQLVAGVDVRILLLDAPAVDRGEDPIQPQDFILYDGRYVRTAQPVDPEDKTGLHKRAALNLSPDFVAGYKNKYSTLHSKSQPAIDIFQGLESEVRRRRFGERAQRSIPFFALGRRFITNRRRSGGPDGNRVTAGVDSGGDHVRAQPDSTVKTEMPNPLRRAETGTRTSGVVETDGTKTAPAGDPLPDPGTGPSGSDIGTT
jgi:hypothetical protein